MAIFHYKIAMPMRWLAGNTHTLGALGYNWSARSMGKAIDALHDAMTVIEKDGSKLLDETFMNKIFSKIYTGENGEAVSLPPLDDAMKYYMGESAVLIVRLFRFLFISQFILHYTEDKQTTAIDGKSRVLPFDKLNCELFYPTRKENKQTKSLVQKMAKEVGECLLKELRDPKKATSDYLTSKGGVFSWGETSEDEHIMCLGKMATNDPAESPFAGLTRQMQTFGRVLGSHASAVAHARYNGDFKRDWKGSKQDGAFHQLSGEMRKSLMIFALSISPSIRQSEMIALNRQRRAKMKKQKMLREKKIVAAQREYANALTFIEMYHSQACWKTAAQVRAGFAKKKSKTAQVEAVKEQIRIRTVGFGWKDLHTPWSKGGVDFTGEYLCEHLINVIIPEQSNWDIPEVPPVDLPSRGDRQQLGTMTADVVALDKKRAGKVKAFRRAGTKLREEMEKDGEKDRYERMQPEKPNVDETLIGSRIEMCWVYTEQNRTKVKVWCKCLVVAVLKGDKVHVQWDAD